jgi:hypothetical protein
VRRSSKNLASLHVSVGCGECLLRAEDCEKGAADGVLHGEPCQSFSGTSSDDTRLCLPHHGASKTEVDWVPGQQPSRGSTPDTPARRRGQDRTRDRWNDGLRQKLTVDVVGGGSVRLPDRIEARQVGSFGHAHVRRRCINLLERGSDSRIVIEAY